MIGDDGWYFFVGEDDVGSYVRGEGETMLVEPSAEREVYVIDDN